MEQSLWTKRLWISVLVLSSMSISWGCASSGNYSLGVLTANPHQFGRVEVEEVQVGATTHELKSQTPWVLRILIIYAIQQENLYQEVSTELDGQEDAIGIACRVREFNNGSQFARWVSSGLGPGKGHLDVDCDFIEKSSSNVFASGSFTGQIQGGFLGGASNEESLSKHVARQIARFLKKGN